MTDAPTQQTIVVTYNEGQKAPSQEQIAEALKSLGTSEIEVRDGNALAKQHAEFAPAPTTSFMDRHKEANPIAPRKDIPESGVHAR